MHLKVANMAQCLAQVNAAIDKFRVKGGAAVARMMKDAQLHATHISPIYSGDFASNWNVSYGAVDATFHATSDYYGLEVPAPKASAWGVGNFNMAGYKLGQPVFLSNAAKHDEPYAWKIENNLIEFRPVNVGKDRVMGKTLEYLKRHHKRVRVGV